MKLSNLIYLVIIFGLCSKLFAWENRLTHPAITYECTTTSYIDDYLKTQMGLTNGISTQLYWNFPQDIKTRIDRGDANPNQTTRNISEWLQVGSIIEDTEESPDPRRAIAPWRPRHHFHDPNRNAGLDNHTDHPDWESPFWSSWLPLGQSALNWAISGTAAQEPFTNNEMWENARSMFYDSLRSTSRNTREAQLAEAMLKLGCVLHLLEDMGVPAHARNDFLFAHYRSVYTRDYGNPLEMWAEGQVAAAGNNIPANWMTGWTPAPKVYSKVSDYFDTDTRNADSYLGDGISPPATWGLSESTNYQFFSWSTISPLTSSLYYFPHPDIDRCNVREESGRTYLYGYAVDHLAKFTMSEDFLAHGHLEQAWCTLGEAIYNDYVRITVPRTIDYVTGLTNYFFRGRLSATAECIDCNIFEVTITNQSSNSGVQQTLKGGAFELYWDDNSGNRTKITDFEIDGGWTSSSTLAYGVSTTGVFTKPEGEVEKYILIYKGNICANPAAPDTDDENAMAVTTITAPSDDCCIEYGEDCSSCNGITPKYLRVIVAGVQSCEGICRWWQYDLPLDCKLKNIPNLNGTYILTQEEDNPCYWSNYNAISPYQIEADWYRRDEINCECSYYLHTNVFNDEEEPVVLFRKTNFGGIGIVGNNIYFYGEILIDNCVDEIVISNVWTVCEKCSQGLANTNVAIGGTMTILPY